MPDFDTLAASLRHWMAMLDADDAAAVELLLNDETWIRRRDFQEACLGYDEEEDVWYIRWRDARQFLETGPRAHTTALTMLRVALAIAFDDFDLLKLGHVHRQWVVAAFARALRVEEPASRSRGIQIGHGNVQNNVW